MRDWAVTKRLSGRVLGVEFRVVPSTFEETLDKALFPSPADYVRQNALEKAREVYARLQSESPIVIGSDSIVVQDNIIFEKPQSDDDARRMMRLFSGRSHKVLTAVAILAPNAAKGGACETFVCVEETDVEFGDLSDDLIEAYVATGEHTDKAGGYGYQALGALFVTRISGCYYNIVGFPLFRVRKMLEDMVAQGVL
ncbi:hypothetical protein HK105_202034 [Polyrhizophydium stewartii]|uniref:Uncharacterized protein n=1 Tax=Polyrhizophydium stewartii TaxID=2732419 RepID=A0ABR4NGH5_9FUNG